jgi:hypothetical protein
MFNLILVNLLLNKNKKNELKMIYFFRRNFIVEKNYADLIICDH